MLRKNLDNNHGFSLVITITLMVLLSLLAVGLLGLSSTTLRSATAQKSHSVARANARLSLQLAIARLQELAGPDTRVTAPASAVSGVDGARQLHGVWRSWEGQDHSDTGLPIAPDYDSKLAQASNDDSGTGKFLGWLVSGTEGENAADSPPTPAQSSESVPLLAEGSLGSSSNDEVHLEPVPIDSADGTEGSYAWWIQGENTKVRLRPTEPAEDNDEILEQMLVSPGPSGEDFSIADTSGTDRAVSLKSLDLLAESNEGETISQQFFHDLTTHSQGLLTNTANGGWHRDLSLLSENWDDIEEGFSSFTISPGESLTAGKTNLGGNTQNNPLIYPWTTQVGDTFTNSVSWNALVDYMTQYRDITGSGDEVALLAEVTNDLHEDWIDKVQRLPVLARVHYVISLSAEELSSGLFQPAIILNPVVTMWNPYNVSLDLSAIPNYSLQLQLGAPIEITLECGTETQTVNLRQFGNERWTLPATATTNNGSAVWLPGEVRTFSPSGNATIVESGTSSQLAFVNGYSPSGGARFTVNGFSPMDGSVTYRATEANNGFNLNLANVKGSGFYFTHRRSETGNQWQPDKTTNIQCALDVADGQAMLGARVPLTMVSDSLSNFAASDSSLEPFLSIVSSLRFGRDVNNTQNNIIVNGIHNMNPAIGYMSQGTDDTDFTDLAGRFDLFPYNVQFFAVNGASSPGLPSGLAGDPEGYLAGGFGAGDGLTNLICLDIPTRPLRTIGDLQHFNVNACNRFAPYTLNPLGNGRASPFIKSDLVQVEGTTVNAIGHDHSYCINHLLLDDWFISSIAPETSPWSASEERSLTEVYTDHLSGEEPLPHNFYKPSNTTTDADADAAEFLADSDSWQKVASELIVPGMFNINSTSETAWATLLKKNFASNDGRFLSFESSAVGSGDGEAQSQTSDGFPFPRNTLNSDTSDSNSAFAALAAPTVFTEQHIEALAREIVVEIKKRGPFLSLAEFYNRQLSSDTELAHTAAVESALLRLSTGSSDENPYSDLVTTYADEASTSDALGGTLDYPFPEAAVGNPAYGFPGWTRQADVLRSISGILSARDDTFIIRAYGDARDPKTNRIISQAWCEAVVQRQAEYMDSSATSGDDKNTLPSEETLNSSTNQRFGRRFKMVSFRWLNPEEV